MTDANQAPSAASGTPASPSGPGLTPRRRRLAITVIGGGALVAAALGLTFWFYWSARVSTDDAQIEGNIVPIGTRVGGTVREVLVDDNQAVEAGAVLARIDPADYEVAVRRAEAELANARATASAARTSVPITSTTASSRLQTAQAALAAAKKNVDAATARLAEAQANQDRASADLARYRQLIEKDEISAQQFDTAVTSETAARATVDAARAALAAAGSQVARGEAEVRAAETGTEQVDVARARAEAAEAVAQKNEAALAQARLNLGYTTIAAPVAGIVSRKSVQPGQVIQAGQPLLALVPLDRIWVVANFKESQLRRMRPGQAAEVYVDAYARTYRGHVDSIGGATAAKFSLLPPENATGNFVKVVQRVPVKIVLEKDQDPDHLLRPGMSVVPTVVVR
jgi:membrane fusion protein (multidrug efflux system)